MKEPRKGYIWNECATGGGYWTKVKGESHSHKLQFFCPYESCRRPTGTIDDKYLLEFGICSLCYVMYVENRSIPTIDLEKYKPKNKE